MLGTAGTAERGRELIERLEPDVALIDIRLGEESGIDLTAQLIDADPERRIVLYTGSNEIELLISGLDSGARGYALKEGTQDELRTALRDGRRGRHVRRPAPAPGAALAPGHPDAEGRSPSASARSWTCSPRA